MIEPILKSSQLRRSALKSAHRQEKKAAKEKKLKASQKERGKLSARMKMDIRERDKNLCQLCLTPGTADDPLVFDHLIPIEKFGRTCESNIALLHRSCNAAKGARLLTILKNIGHAIKEPV